jgi:hypothetical protein
MHDSRVVHQDVLDRILHHLKDYPQRGVAHRKNNHMRKKYMRIHIWPTVRMIESQSRVIAHLLADT